MRKRNPVGRPKSGKEVLSVERPIKFAPSMYEKLQEASSKDGVSVAEKVRRAVQKEFDTSEPKAARKIPLLGFIPASPAALVCPIFGAYIDLPPHRPDLKADYALIVTGHSMECEDVATIPDGAYAYFASTEHAEPRPRDIVHVEFIDDSALNNEVALAIYKPQPDGSVIFDKCNKDYQPIVRKVGEPYQIKGVLLMPYKEQGYSIGVDIE